MSKAEPVHSVAYKDGRLVQPAVDGPTGNERSNRWTDETKRVADRMYWVDRWKIKTTSAQSINARASEVTSLHSACMEIHENTIVLSV